MFRGSYTAIVTPFNADGGVDYDAFVRLVERQLDAGIDGIVPVGTTGESPTLRTDEHLKVIQLCVEACKGRGKVIAGTGANALAEALELTAKAAEMGVDGTLQVTPYYNKPNVRGLVQHFGKVADLGLPVMLYNVPGRSGKEIAYEAVAELASHPHVVAVKEAGGSVDRVSTICRMCPDLDVFSGDDALCLPMMAVGGAGVVSVASNIVPAEVAKLVNLALDNKLVEARELHLRYHELFTHLFLDTNPIPVKAAMAMMGLCEEVYRLPLCSMDDALKDRLADTMRSVNLIN